MDSPFGYCDLLYAPPGQGIASAVVSAKVNHQPDACTFNEIHHFAPNKFISILDRPCDVVSRRRSRIEHLWRDGQRSSPVLQDDLVCLEASSAEFVGNLRLRKLSKSMI